MAKNGKPSENKVHAPVVKSKGGKTKHRKGGEKARKLGPTRRLARALARFTSVSEELTHHKQVEAQHIRNFVRDGDLKPMSGAEFTDRLNRPRHKTVNPHKIARLLMPNGY